MELKIAQIKELFHHTPMEGQQELIIRYQEDERSGVKNLVNHAEKKLKAWKREQNRIEGMKEYEKRYQEYELICGIDEVGRGPLAGPVVAGAVILPKDCDILYLNDSKQLSEKQREELYLQIQEKAIAVGLGCISAERIDEINILQATYEAMREAIRNLGMVPGLLLNDAVTIPGIEIPQIPIIKGDTKSISIAAASIVAKVTRDRMMVEYDSLYPMYGFASNKGYGAKVHQEALRQYGASPIHRRSFIQKIMESERK